ncbi:PTS fructose transporter subunit IIC [Olsenella massiliensis]|uniref:PTS fructose transporter subunit IIC n=1 Tax=Olsenella massiliensis TaxID=1622075 RepID=UPI00071C3BCC|nr:PTS fructose transporter subunit IIC [Olsenella massiliensis]
MAEIKRKNVKKKTAGRQAWDAVLTGISYMIPFIVGGGVLWGIAKAMGGYNIAGDMKSLIAAGGSYKDYTLAMVIYSIGSAIFDVCVPIIGAYTAYALSDKPGLAPGFAVGVISNTIKAGFLGAVIGGIIAGYIVIFLKDASKKVPSSIQSVFPILIIPVVGTAITSLLMWYIIGVPIGWFMIAITSLLTNLQGIGGAVFGAAIGVGMSIDQGGPISKAVALVANGLNADGILGPAACKMCGGMQNPLGVCFAQIIDRFAGKKKFTEKERSTTVSGLVLACCYIQEYVIPFLVQDTWRCIIPCMVGGAISGGLCGYFALESAAVHGGVFVIPMMSNPLQFILFWFVGAAINGTLYFLLRKPVGAEGDMAGNGVLDQLLA